MSATAPEPWHRQQRRDRIDDRLHRWATYARGWTGPRYDTLLGELIEEGWAALISGSGSRQIPDWPDDVRRTEAAILELSRRDQALVRLHYFWPAGLLHQKAAAMRMGVRGYTKWLDRVQYALWLKLY